MSAVYLIVCENEKEGEFPCKENSPSLLDFLGCRLVPLRADDDRDECRAGDAHQHAGAERVGHRLGIAALFDER